MSSRELKGKRVVVWPAYIDELASRREGRKIARVKAVRRPSVEEIVQAAKLLGLNPEVEQKRYPRAWWEQDARVIVDKRGPKRQILEIIASKIAKLRKRSS
ncbi:MAG: signal recognition particle protein Srp19 [Acidilobaceae archaeon]|nr:signal recognition particle protein Srp19 [Acidilobaceae archaeon]